MTDDDGDSGYSEYRSIVVYDPDGGFVTGGGLSFAVGRVHLSYAVAGSTRASDAPGPPGSLRQAGWWSGAMAGERAEGPGPSLGCYLRQGGNSMATGSEKSVTPSLSLRETTAMVDGIELYYRIGGSGPPLVVLHGFTLSGRMWDPFLDEQLGKDHTVIVPDLPGHGHSERPTGDFTFREAARLVFGILDGLGVERVRGLGFSAGTMTLIHMALQQSERMEAMGSSLVRIANRKKCASDSGKPVGRIRAQNG